VSDFFVSPDREIPLAQIRITLNGSFATLRAIQQAFGKDILNVQAGLLDMRQDEIARLISLATGLDELLVGQTILDHYDIAGRDYRQLKAELMAWLAVAMTPKRDRKKKAEESQAIIDSLSDSPGPSTSSSASAPSTGRRKRSGRATSGK
jgi:hypothetical protein